MTAIIDYGAGNVGSVLFALERLGFEARLTSDKDEIRNADRVIFPGVGSAGNAMQKLKETGLDQVIPKLEQPVLGICLGMQLLCRFSQEGDTKCLGIFDADVLRFPDNLRVPHIGWNSVEAFEASLFRNTPMPRDVYFVHSYFVPEIPETIMSASYGLRFSAAIRKNNFYGVQFHPEKSGSLGEILLKNFLEL